MSTTASSQTDLTGTRDNLTPSQTRALYRLWHRFFRLCEMPAGSLSTSESGHSASQTIPGSVKGGVKPGIIDAQQNIKSSTTALAIEKPSEAAGEQESRLHRAVSSPLINRSDSRMRGQNYDGGPSVGAGYGKPLQRQSSNVRQIDDRGSHIPKDDRVKDELKTLEEAKEMREFLERYGGERLRQVFWDMVKGEHPDAVMLRFLRARKWNVDRAIAVIGSTAAFRADNDVTEIVRGGELALTSTRGGMNMLANGISYIYGATSIGEPVYFIEVGNHFSHNQTQQELKKGVIFLQELLQLLMPPPIERKVVIFNMNHFGIRNMDWWCVFFMVKTMESYYVETLSRVYVHGAPWIFKPIWAILKPLLDPVVRDKVRLTFSAEELAEHVPFTHLPKDSMRGGMDWKFEYPRPDEHENDKQLDTDTRDRLQQEYMAIAAQFERATMDVAELYTSASLMRKRAQAARRTTAKAGLYENNALSSDDEDGEGDQRDGYDRLHGVARGSDATATATELGDENDLGASLKAKRDVLATRLRVAFLRLRPYIVGKSMIDRWGVSREDGSIVWQYRSLDGQEEEQALGLGTTLPELERNLNLIDQASRSREADRTSDVGHEDEVHNNKSTTNKTSPLTGAAQARHLTAHDVGQGSSSHSPQMHAGTTMTTGEMNRRQQRLQNRSRPTSNALDYEAARSEEQLAKRTDGADADEASAPRSEGEVQAQEQKASANDADVGDAQKRVAEMGLGAEQDTLGAEEPRRRDLADKDEQNAPVPVHPLSTNGQGSSPALS